MVLRAGIPHFIEDFHDGFPEDTSKLHKLIELIFLVFSNIVKT